MSLKPVEPRYKSLVLALAPQPRQMPPPPFDEGELQRIFADVTRQHPYQAFEFIYDRRGAQFHNGEDDLVELRPAQFRIIAKMDGMDLLTESMAADKALRIMRIAADRLKVEVFLQCAVQVIATVDAPNEDARGFVADKLLKGADQAAELGPDYFGGGVRFRHLRPEDGGEDSLTIEPDIGNNSLVYIDHQVARVIGPISLEQADTWVRGAFEFVSGPTTRLLSS